MVPESILLTGATGNLGAVTLEHILNSTPHSVNILLRNISTSLEHFTSKYPSAISSGRLTLTSVPDMSVPGVFDGPASSATVIMHIATPLATSDFEKNMIDPTWAIDKNVLEAAKKSGNVKRVIICGTILQTLRIDTDLFNSNLTVDESRFNDLTLEEAKNAAVPAYQYSKTNAERKVWQWMKENEGSVGFDVVMLLPPMITGRSPQFGYKPSGDSPGGISGVWRALFGKDADGMTGVFPYWLDTDDVARCHILSMSKAKVPGNERYLLASKDILNLRKIVNEIRRETPAVAERISTFVDERDTFEGKIANLDTSKADKVFGTEWKGGYNSIRETVLDVLKWEKEQHDGEKV